MSAPSQIEQRVLVGGVCGISDLAANGSCAVVGHLGLDGLWILCRNPIMGEVDDQRLVTRFAQGNGTAQLVRTLQVAGLTLAGNSPAPERS